MQILEQADYENGNTNHFFFFFTTVVSFQKWKKGGLPWVQWLKLQLPMQEVQVQNLFRELRSHMSRAKKLKHKTEAVL